MGTDSQRKLRLVRNVLYALIFSLIAGWWCCGWYEDSLYSEIWGYAKTGTRLGNEVPVEVKGETYYVSPNLQRRLADVHYAEIIIGGVFVALFFAGRHIDKALKAG